MYAQLYTSLDVEICMHSFTHH